MQYKVSFIDKDGNDFIGTTEHFVTDGRYSADTVWQVAYNVKQKSLKRDYITGYIVRRGSFNNPVIMRGAL